MPVESPLQTAEPQGFGGFSGLSGSVSHRRPFAFIRILHFICRGDLNPLTNPRVHTEFVMQYSCDAKFESRRLEAWDPLSSPLLHRTCSVRLLKTCYSKPLPNLNRSASLEYS